MKRTRNIILALALICIMLVPAAAMAGELDGLMSALKVRASADMGLFKTDLSATFKVPVPKVDELLKVIPTPEDVYMALRVSEVSKQPVERVVEEFQANKNKGWGVIAKNLGIKPGSAEFHALKEGRLPERGKGGSGATGGGEAPSKGKGKGKK